MAKSQPWQAGPIPPVSRPSPVTPVYLIMSAFRDGERCARSIGFAFEKAEHPDRIRVRVMQAMGDSEVSCPHHFKDNELKAYCHGHFPDAEKACRQRVLSQVEVWTIPLERGMGPAHQRGLLNEQLEFESPDAFCLTTDSHMDFHHKWDSLMVDDWLSTNNEFAVLTAYPFDMSDSEEQIYASQHVDLCGYTLENGIPRGRGGGNLLTQPGDRPYFTMNWAAGFSFHRCHADRNVPVDKHLKFIFTGEEIDRAVRLWTNGYDLYNPVRATIFHNYTAAKQEFWSYHGAHMAEDETMAKRRLATLLELELDGYPRLPASDMEPYGLGRQRTLEQYVEWSRIDLGTESWRRHLSQAGDAEAPEECQSAKLAYVPVMDVKQLRASVQKGGPPPPKSRLPPTVF